MLIMRGIFIKSCLQVYISRSFSNWGHTHSANHLFFINVLFSPESIRVVRVFSLLRIVNQKYSKTLHPETQKSVPVFWYICTQKHIVIIWWSNRSPPWFSPLFPGFPRKKHLVLFIYCISFLIRPHLKF